MGRKRLCPHESWYQTAPYYYYFGHYYAARLLEKLGEPDKAKYGEQLAAADHAVPGTRRSWWDYAMWDYHKPYGTAFAIMTLAALPVVARECEHLRQVCVQLTKLRRMISPAAHLTPGEN